MTSDFKVDEGPNKPPNMEFYRVKIVGPSDMVGRYLGQKMAEKRRTSFMDVPLASRSL